MDKLKLAAAALDFTFAHGSLTPRREEALHGLVAEVEGLLALNDEAVVAKRLARFKVGAPADYRERMIELGRGRGMLCGIRWAGLNPEAPFVSVWPDFAVAAPEDLDGIAAAVRSELGIFAPKHAALWLNPETPRIAELRAQGSTQLRVIAGIAAALRSTPRPEGYGDMTLEAPVDGSYYEFYADAYRAFHAAQPELKDWVPLNDREEMEECRAAGLLFVARVGGERAGLIAAKPRPLLGQDGAYFTDILLTGAYKGKGLASALQRRFIDLLPEEVEVVWGTIDAGNASSTRTALKIGRRIVREELFVPLR